MHLLDDCLVKNSNILTFTSQGLFVIIAVNYFVLTDLSFTFHSSVNEVGYLNPSGRNNLSYPYCKFYKSISNSLSFQICQISNCIPLTCLFPLVIMDLG